MDRIIKITIGLIIVILIAFAAVVAYNNYIVAEYRNSLTSSYSYSCTFSTEDVLTNVTFFLPVPEDTKGNSPIITEIGNHHVNGIPHDWSATLYGTGKTTYLKISTPSLGLPPINGSAQTSIVLLTVTAPSPGPIDTLTPIQNAEVFRPVQSIQNEACPALNATPGQTSCYRYLTSVYADYTASPRAVVRINAGLDARNTWKISEPASNAYKNTVAVELHGDNHGWVTTTGWLESGIGSYNVPDISP
jgi:hypothetical protein